MLPPDWGLLARVARKLGVTQSLVSRVNAGKATSARVSEALEAERAQRRLRSPMPTPTKPAIGIRNGG